ncbi:MAG: maleylacetoacetate isomerase [Novosphingobium meiothermophilum]|uniref:maleylacetoacetate isomerase n=1 Tax=Novosphingobium TaxID=165696 RepID=UPI000D6E1C5B|nr:MULTISPECIES: maleylacetoacetate isomerase [Novosphingobium]
MSQELVLHGYWRSSASWRVRIALALKGLAWDSAPHDLRTGEQRTASYLALNPQGVVPSLVVDGEVLTQSMAICEYLDETHPEPPLLPGTALERARIRAFAQAIACEIHPLQNLRVLKMVRALGQDEAGVNRWAAEVIERGLEACAQLVAGQDGPYCFGAQVTLADVLLVPQLGNARRYGARFDFGRIPAIEAACMELPAFAETAPARQSDAD